MELRYHHALCLPRFEGKGYSDDFCTNMQKIKDCYKNEEVTFVEHCDEVCSHCPNNINGKCKDEEKVKKYDAKVKELMQRGTTLKPSIVCNDCKWYYICKNAD